MKQLILLFFLVFSVNNALFSQTPSITNIRVSQRTDGSGNVDIYYDLTGQASNYLISMEVSFDNGNTFTALSPSFLTGNVGSVTPGSNLYIVWNGKGSNNNTYSLQTKVKLIAIAIFQCGQPFTDPRDGKSYNTVQIGAQCWMAQNLNIGTRINGTISPTDNGIIEKYCYLNQESNCDIYGAQYQWYEMMAYEQVEGVQGICPTGWHIPSDGEWTTLSTVLGGTAVAGGKMKATGTVQAGTGLWNSPNTGATNESGFSGVPGGGRNGYGTFGDINVKGTCWSSTAYDWDDARCNYLRYNSSGATRGWTYKISGFSVRCMRDN